jgi:hypothetical protein
MGTGVLTARFSSVWRVFREWKISRACLAFLWLFVCDIALRTGGIKRLRAVMPKQIKTAAADATELARALALAEIVMSTSGYYYKQTWCLHRAAATCSLLRRYGVSAEVCIGFRRMPFVGHAWVEWNGTVLVDTPNSIATLRVLDRL